MVEKERNPTAGGRTSGRGDRHGRELPLDKSYRGEENGEGPLPIAGLHSSGSLYAALDAENATLRWTTDLRVDFYDGFPVILLYIYIYR